MSLSMLRAGRITVAGLGLMLCLSSLPTAAHGAGFATLQNAEPGRVRSFWTPERLAAARPLAAPEVSTARIAELEAALEEAPIPAAGPGSGVGSRPLPGIRPQLSHRLFDPADDDVRAEKAGFDGIFDRASGSTGAHFTSHRLIPEEADLFYPYSTVGKIFFTIPGQSGTFYCSAAVIRLRLVVTAGGCVHAGKSPGFYGNFLFVPAYRDGNDPYSTWEWSYVVAPTTWTQGGGTLPNAADYALIEVEDQIYNGVLRKLGQVTGTPGYVIKKLKPNHATIVAYSSNFDLGEQQHQVDAKDFKATSTSTNTIEYGSDMRGGSQGGPLFQDFGDNPATLKLIGVLSYYFTSTSTKTEGASIPDSRFTSLLTTACNNRSGNC